MEGRNIIENFGPKIFKVGESLKHFEKSSRDVLRVIIVGNRPCLIKKVSASEAEVLYREVKDENQPSKGYLKLENYILTDERIWSRDIYDFQEPGGEWDKKLNAVGIK